MVKLTGVFNDLKAVKVALFGDFMVDLYTTGSVQRVSPEAPVPVLLAQDAYRLPGGAGNVALNLCALGAEVSAFGLVGADSEGEKLRKLLSKEGIDLSGMVEGAHTCVKNRLIANTQQLIRIDSEISEALPDSIATEILKRLRAQINEYAIIAISDYGKGFLTNYLLEGIISIGREFCTPVIVDPKGIDFTKYHGATMVKPNLMEAYRAADLPTSASLDRVAERLFEICEPTSLLITRSEKGMSLFTREKGRSDFPARVMEVNDVTGAGDTALSVITFVLANGIDLEHAVPLANLASGIAVEKLGCARVTLSQIALRLLEQDVGSKVFDENHLFALTKALQGSEYLLTCIEEKVDLLDLHEGLLQLKQRHPNQRIVVYLDHAISDPRWVSLLSSLSEVDSIILQTHSLNHLCERLKPKTIYLFKDKFVSYKESLLVNST
ncbi:MAG: bifunctional ADP-heptose synthase [Simkaniaceae bacterium]|nr:bifunctional ADP-heptose synthase [Simkaniaceae bacterium]